MPYTYDGAGQPDYDGSEPETPSPKCHVWPIVDEVDGSDIIAGYGLYDADDLSRIGVEMWPTIREAAEAAEALGWDPYLTDDEMDAENEALEHGDWPF